jgi:hypothetical protein
VRLAGKFQRRDLSRLRALCPQIYHSGILIILNSSYLRNIQGGTFHRPLISASLRAGNTSHMKDVLPASGGREKLF